MNRGYEGRAIFSKQREKELFLELLSKCSRLLKIEVLAYCLMDNHYHLVLQNNSGRMSDFFKQLNGQFGTLYRKFNGGKGYVFEDRFKSMLIQDDAYLLMVIAYVLNNPVRAGLVRHFSHYTWSSGDLYFSKKCVDYVVNSVVEELFGNKENLTGFVESVDLKELPTVKTEMGTIIGGEEFMNNAIKKFNRRSGKESTERKRVDDKYFESADKVFFEFENKHDIDPDQIDTKTHDGKKLRAELLVNLRDRAGLKYSEIIKFELFSDVKINSLGVVYQRAKNKWKKTVTKNVKM
jgi:REP element-mobilizing transposase RayT